MELHSAFKAFTSFGITNPCCLIRDRLESHLFSNHRQGLGIQPCCNQRQGFGFQPAVTTFTLFKNVSDITNVTPSSTKSHFIGNFLWRGHCYYASIKDSMSTACTLCKHTCKVMILMVLTEKGHLGADIWPKTPQQAKSTKSIMRAAWNTKAMHWQNASRTLDSPLCPTGEEAKHVGALLIFDWCQQNS